MRDVFGPWGRLERPKPENATSQTGGTDRAQENRLSPENQPSRENIKAKSAFNIDNLKSPLDPLSCFAACFAF
jgi:hypothetical protein